MPTAEAQVPTARARRYLVQLCRHASHQGHRPHPHGGGGGGAPPEVWHVTWSDTVATIRFGHGHCVLHATDDALVLSVDADDEGSLQRLTEGITSRLEAMGRRDQLAVNWQTPDPAPELGAGETSGATAAPTSSTSAARRHRGLTRTLLLTGVVVLVIVVHLGLLGGALAAWTWARWASNIVLVVIALKVIAVSVHVLLGRLAIRRGFGGQSHRGPPKVPAGAFQLRARRGDTPLAPQPTRQSGRTQ